MCASFSVYLHNMSHAYSVGAHTALTRLGLSKLAAIPPEVLARAAQEGASGAFSEAAPVWNAMRGFKGTPEQGRAHLLQQLDALTNAARQGPAGGTVPPQLFSIKAPAALEHTLPSATASTAPARALPGATPVNPPGAAAARGATVDAPMAPVLGGPRVRRPFSWHE